MTPQMLVKLSDIELYENPVISSPIILHIQTEGQTERQTDSCLKEVPRLRRSLKSSCNNIVNNHKFGTDIVHLDLNLPPSS
jgi:spore coat protein CotF